MRSVEILARNGITDGNRIHKCGCIVNDPSPRLIELAQTGELVLGERVARFYNFKQTEAEQSARVLEQTQPTLDRVREAARAYGCEVVESGQLAQYQAELVTLHSQNASLQTQVAEVAGLQAMQTEMADTIVGLQSTVSGLEAHIESLLVASVDVATSPIEAAVPVDVATSPIEAAVPVDGVVAEVAPPEAEAVAETVVEGKKK